jgi:hypothetical protein
MNVPERTRRSVCSRLLRGAEHGISMRRPAEFAAQVNAFAARVFAAP